MYVMYTCASSGLNPPPRLILSPHYYHVIPLIGKDADDGWDKIHDMNVRTKVTHCILCIVVKRNFK